MNGKKSVRQENDVELKTVHRHNQRKQLSHTNQRIYNPICQMIEIVNA